MVHPVSCQIDDTGCTEGKCNFRRQIRNPQLIGRGLLITYPAWSRQRGRRSSSRRRVRPSREETVSAARRRWIYVMKWWGDLMMLVSRCCSGTLVHYAASPMMPARHAKSLQVFSLFSLKLRTVPCYRFSLMSLDSIQKRPIILAQMFTFAARELGRSILLRFVGTGKL